MDLLVFKNGVAALNYSYLWKVIPAYLNVEFIVLF